MGNEKIIEAIGKLGGPSKAARALGVSVQAVCFWRDGERQFPPALCISVEKLTDGQVRCEDIRPDIDWAYLRNNNKQPAHV